MTGEEIKLKIDQNNLEIEHFLRPNQFVLNNMVAELIDENSKLQAICPHSFKDGFCVYCYKQQEE